MSGARVGVVVLAGLVGAAISLGASAPAASAMDVPLSFEMHTLLPGETRSAEGDVEVAIRSTVATASFEASGADAAWSALLCAPGGSCTDVAALEGTVLDAGTYRIVVDVTTPDDFALGGTASAEGVLRLAQVSDDGLAVTGGSVPWLAGSLGAALAAAGAILLIAGRRRREDARMSRLRTAVTASVAALALLVGGAAVISAVSLTQSAWADRTQVSAPVTGGTWNAPTSVGCVAMNANGTAKSGGYCTVKSVTVSNEWGNAGSRTRNYTANFDTNAAEGYIQFTIDLSKGGGAANFSWTNAGLVTGNNAQATPNNGWTCAQLPILTAKTPTNWGWGANSSIFFQITENRTTTASTCS